MRRNFQMNWINIFVNAKIIQNVAQNWLNNNCFIWAVLSSVGHPLARSYVQPNDRPPARWGCKQIKATVSQPLFFDKEQIAEEA